MKQTPAFPKVSHEPRPHSETAAPSAGEDAEGHSDQERLVAEGMAEAGHDQMHQASLKRDS